MQRRDSSLWGYADICGGGSLDRVHQMRVVSSKIAIFVSCGRYIFRNFIYQTKIIMSECVVPNGFSSTTKDLTLNDLEEPFCAIVYWVESFSVGALVLRHDCFKIDANSRILVITVSIEDIRLMPIFVGVRWWGAVKWECGRRSLSYEVPHWLYIEIYSASLGFPTQREHGCCYSILCSTFYSSGCSLTP